MIRYRSNRQGGAGMTVRRTRAADEDLSDAWRLAGAIAAARLSHAGRGKAGPWGAIKPSKGANRREAMHEQRRGRAKAAPERLACGREAHPA